MPNRAICDNKRRCSTWVRHLGFYQNQPGGVWRPLCKNMQRMHDNGSHPLRCGPLLQLLDSASQSFCEPIANFLGTDTFVRGLPPPVKFLQRLGSRFACDARRIVGP